ncbi:DEAD/DEAH box helicase [Amycolatopsis palatopharyngis]|uniref:DEAD/DEAH box helicase n=1 Tax=Amycolatopsis palatopharyngis TaxID=187982 RepID=UPI000E21CADF|nr:SNF2-related protein [Amycolatopsis palatopharyngis]
MPPPDTQPPDSAVDAAKAKVGAAARATIDSVRAFAERTAALLNAPAALRASAQQQTAILADRQVQVALHAKPITELRDLAGKGARLGTLADAGYSTVGSVANAQPFQLEAVPGIGPQTSQRVSSVARQLAAQLRRDTRVRLDPDRQDPGQTQLLAILAATRRADSAVASLRQPLQQFVAQTTPLVAQAERAASRASMFFSGRAKKRSALAALAQLDAILAEPRVVSLQQTVQQQERALNPDSYSPQQLWQEYANEAASVNALLSTVGGAGEQDETEAAQGYIPEELRQAISAVPLDLSMLTATLRGYQAFGAQYAIHQQRSILGDEMGLGKTVEALTVMAHLAAKGQLRFLVVCPASVQINWINEIGKHTKLSAHSLHGADRDSATQRWLRAGGVAVTTFNTLDRLDGVLNSEVALLVVDEAHYVKNPNARRSQVIAAAGTNAQRVLFLTGTPMENRVEEFRNLVQYLQPKVAARVNATDAIAGAKRFRRVVAPVYLRRNQEDVLTELPDKIEIEDWVQPTPADEKIYEADVRDRKLMQMRQAAWKSPDSAKLDRLAEIVDEAREDGRKVIVFSYFLQVLSTIQDKLGGAAMGPISGSVPAPARQELVDAFTRHEGHAVLLSQIEAGGVGLNVQAASVVILAEPQWKPSTEEQAIARAYRMGQIRKVQVHRLLAKGTVDERIREIQERKSLLFAEFARKSDAKDADNRSVDTSEHRPAVLDDEAVPMERRIILAEQHRLGIT